MTFKKTKDFKIYYTFLNKLAKDLTNFYYTKLNKTFTINNKLKGKGYDPVTSADKAFEKFIRKKINDKFPDHQIIGEEFGAKKAKQFQKAIEQVFGRQGMGFENPMDGYNFIFNLINLEEPKEKEDNMPEMEKMPEIPEGHHMHSDGTIMADEDMK